MAIKITIKGLDTATAEIKNAVREGVQNALGVAGVRGAALVKETIVNPYLGRGPAVATGILANSITFVETKTVDITRLEIKATPPAESYAGYVEAGTGPHFPPPSALLLWVKKKFSVTNEKQALSIAFAVARKIAKRGTSGFGMFARSEPKLESGLPGIFQEQIAKSIKAAGVEKK